MADPLRRTLLAKLRGKKAKKVATVGAGGGYGSSATAAAAAAAAANGGGREGKEKVLQTQTNSELPGVLLTVRMSTYENCVDGAAVVVGVRGRRAAESAAARPPEGCDGAGAGGRVRVNEQLLGVALQREEMFGELMCSLGERSHQGPADKITLKAPHVQRKHFVSVPRQCSVGDSIGFGDNSKHVLCRIPAQTHTGGGKHPEGTAAITDSEGPESQHMVGAAVSLQENNDNRGFDSDPSFETDSHQCAALLHPNAIPTNIDESILFQTIESYGPEYAGEIKGTVGSLQSPTFFPTELEICDINMASLCATQSSIRYSLDSEDDYYDNEILPFYETIRVKSEEAAELPASGQEKGQLHDSNSAQETDRLRNQLKEAYYLLINAMNDINMDVQQVSAVLSTSSCSSHSRDSLCSRSSAKNMDSDSWSSGGEPSPQQVSDTDSLLLCLSGNTETELKSRLNSKSMADLPVTESRPSIQRSASDGAIRYPEGLITSAKVTGRQRSESCDDTQSKEVEEGIMRGEGELSDHNAISSDELLQDAGAEEETGRELNESSGSVNSLTGSSDSNTEASAHQGHHNNGELMTGARAQVLHKGHGVTVNKMQEWMHKGRLLSSEMKQRIEGSSLPRAGGPHQDQSSPQASHSGSKPVVQTSNRGLKSGKTKSPTHKSPQLQQPAFVENAQTPCVNGREVGRANEPSAWRQPLTTITVSKKRNWLQQSTLGKSYNTRDEPQGMLGAEEENSHGFCQLPPPSSPSPDHLKPSGGAPMRPVRLQLPQVCVGQTKVSPYPRNVDPAEENDADDEGEIWYNPIPEDEELVSSHRSSNRLLVPPRTEPERRPSRGADVGQGGRSLEGIVTPEAVGEVLGGNLGDGSQGNTVHSTEALHLHRQMLACKPQEEGGASTSRATDGVDLPNAVGFSPPSSPNPAKKSSSINWSFPDKIKSPRTVRKISMKMKKLPELSRKLSVKGHPSSNGGSQPEPRAHSPKNTGSGPDTVTQTSGSPRLAPSGGGQASRNVISRYHLDSSVSTQSSFSKKKSDGSSKSASKGGYLSDGDSPELVAKSGKHGSAEGKGAAKGKEMEGSGGSKLSGTELDIDAFRHYSFTEQPKCSQYISGLMSLHFYGAEDLKPPRVDSRDVYCAIQVDSVNKARTALLTCRTTFLDMDHTFNIELENAQHLKLVVFSWEPTPRRNRVCCHGTVVLPALFRVTRSHQLAVKLEPRGLIYVKLSLMEQWQNSLDGRPDGDREPQVFGLEAWRVVERENSGQMVPLLISKCINEIEKRGCQVVGLYRLCGSAAVKKELREAFERDSLAVALCENTYPDINVITGVLKDYLRELPYPLITKQLYEAVLESMASRPLRMGTAGCENDHADSEHTTSLLENLPEVERMTLRRLLDHLKLVASYQDVNKMTCQNLAVCFGPVLLSQRQEASCHTNRVFIDSEELASALHFKKHIEVLHYLLQLWPVIDPYSQSSIQTPAISLLQAPSDQVSAPPLRRRKERPQFLNLSEAEMAGVLRPKPGRLDSPSNRYAGDWSGCGESYIPSEILLPSSREEADYDDVPSEDTEAAEDGQQKSEDVQDNVEQKDTCPVSDPPDLDQPQQEDLVKLEESEDWTDEEKHLENDIPGNTQILEDEVQEERMCDHILPPPLPKEHTYQAYMKIQDISPVLSNRVNLRDLQESIDTLIGNLERELNKNKLNIGY